jgi:hypothetical protein
MEKKTQLCKSLYFADVFSEALIVIENYSVMEDEWLNSRCELSNLTSLWWCYSDSLMNFYSWMQHHLGMYFPKWKCLLKKMFTMNLHERNPKSIISNHRWLDAVTHEKNLTNLIFSISNLTQLFAFNFRLIIFYDIYEDTRRDFTNNDRQYVERKYYKFIQQVMAIIEKFLKSWKKTFDAHEKNAIKRWNR